MGIRKTVFGSASEKRNYEHLSRQWGGKYRIYHNLPFLNVLDTSNLSDWDLRPIVLEKVDIARLKKTSVDYTLCDQSDAPLVCIEFDGMNDGFNVGTQYHSDFPATPWREIIMNLKLRVAHGSLFPFVVVGSPHFKYLSHDTELAIVDGLIGEVLATRAVAQRVAQGFDPSDIGMTQEQFNLMTDRQKHEAVQNWLSVIEIESDLEFNPIHQECARLENELKVYDLSVQFLTYPDLGLAKDLIERRKMIDDASLEGSKVTVKHPSVGEASAIVMLPRFKTVGISTLSLSQELAHLVALDRLKQKMRRQQ